MSQPVHFICGLVACGWRTYELRKGTNSHNLIDRANSKQIFLKWKVLSGGEIRNSLSPQNATASACSGQAIRLAKQRPAAPTVAVRYIRVIFTYRAISGALTTTRYNATKPNANSAIRPMLFSPVPMLFSSLHF